MASNIAQWSFWIVLVHQLSCTTTKFNKIFTGHEIRTVFNGDDPWFSARDVCGILGLKNVTKAVLSLDQDEKNWGLYDRRGYR